MLPLYFKKYKQGIEKSHSETTVESGEEITGIIESITANVSSKYGCNEQ